MNNRILSKNRFSSDELSVFCGQIGMLLHGGVPLYEGIYVLYQDMENKQTRGILSMIEEGLKDKKTFSSALEDTHWFPEYMIHMIIIGENTGKLEEVMNSLADYYERESQVKESIRTAILYPMVLSTMMVVILLVLVMRILPLFESMYYEINTEVAQASRNSLDFGVNLGKMIAGVTVFLYFMILIALLCYKTKVGREILKGAFSRCSTGRNFIDMMDTSRFISSMALMITSGMDTREALELSIGSSKNSRMQKKIEHGIHLLEEGMPLEEALAQSQLFVGIDGMMIRVGAKSGTVDATFQRLSIEYNQKVTRIMSKISTYIETILVVSLSLMVGTVLIAVMLPLVSVIASIG